MEIPGPQEKTRECSSGTEDLMVGMSLPDLGQHS